MDGNSIFRDFTIIINKWVKGSNLESSEKDMNFQYLKSLVSYKGLCVVFFPFCFCPEVGFVVIRKWFFFLAMRRNLWAFPLENGCSS